MKKELSLLESTIKIGAPKPFSFLHITDVHIDMDTTDKENNTYYFEKALSFAEENNLPIVCTGDIFKCFSKKNFEYAKRMIKHEKGIFIPGNHDFCTFPENDGLGIPERQTEFSQKWIDIYRDVIYFGSRIINGVNFVFLQNIYYEITLGQIQMLQSEVKKGYPVILCMHIPLFSSQKAEEMLSCGNPSAYMLTPPESFLQRYYPPSAKVQAPTKETVYAVEYIKKEPLIKAVVAGHIHENFDGYADCEKRQITTAKLSDSTARLIKVE